MKTGKGVPRKKKKKNSDRVHFSPNSTSTACYLPRREMPREPWPPLTITAGVTLVLSSPSHTHDLCSSSSPSFLRTIPPLPPPYKQLATPTFRPKQAPHGRLNSQPAKFNTPDRRLNVFLSLNEGRYGDKGILFSRRESRGFLSKWSYVTTVRVVP